MATTYLARTFQSGGSGTTWTFSAWVKRGTLGTAQPIWSRYQSSAYGTIGTFNSDDTITFKQWNASVDTGNLTTNRKFRDTNGYYHIVFVWDTTNGTAGDRMKIYVNGVEETSFATDTNPSSSLASTWGNANPMEIARSQSTYFDGLMSHVHFVDGTAYAPTVFGSTDATTGEWKINTSPTMTMGTTGFTILKDGNTITDQSTNSNNWTLGAGTLTNTEDCPDDVFCTLNPLVYSSASKTYAYGNSSITVSASGDWCSTQTSLGASSGKHYCEIKINAVGSFCGIGVGYLPNITNVTSTQLIGELTGSFGWRNSGVLPQGGSSLNTYTTGDILMIAMDSDNQKLYFGKNGTWENSGVPTSGATGTGSIGNLTVGEFYHFVIVPRGSSVYCNFGNGYFGTSAIASEGTNASNIGKFEYDVPTGYTALSTKGLNS